MDGDDSSKKQGLKRLLEKQATGDTTRETIEYRLLWRDYWRD